MKRNVRHLPASLLSFHLLDFNLIMTINTYKWAKFVHFKCKHISSSYFHFKKLNFGFKISLIFQANGAIISGNCCLKLQVYTYILPFMQFDCLFLKFFTIQMIDVELLAAFGQNFLFLFFIPATLKLMIVFLLLLINGIKMFLYKTDSYHVI